MQILSYKILNETSIGRFKQIGGSKGLIKAMQIARQQGVSDVGKSNGPISQIVTIKFNFLRLGNLNQPEIKVDLNFTFGVYFSNNGEILHLYPYISNEISTMQQEDVMNYATLKFYDNNNNNNLLNAYDIISNRKNGNYNFIFNVGNDFQSLNTGVYSKLNTLINYNPQILNTNQVNQNYQFVLFSISNLRNIDDGSANVQKMHNIAFKFTPPQGVNIPQNLQGLINNFSNPKTCTINFNARNRPSGFGNRQNLPNTHPYVSNIISQTNQNIIFTHQSPINLPNMLNIDIPNCYIEVLGINNQNPFLGTLKITNFA
jgi:hypothetical protein